MAQQATQPRTSNLRNLDAFEETNYNVTNILNKTILSKEKTT